MLNSGERSVAAGPEATTLESAARGNPLGVIYPGDGALLMVSPSAVMKNSRRLNAARLFMNFLMSRDASEILVRNFSPAGGPGVGPGPGAKPLAEGKPIPPPARAIPA